MTSTPHKDGLPAAELTKREYIACQTLQGLLANSEGINRVWDEVSQMASSQSARIQLMSQKLSQRAVELADALLGELAR